MLNARNFQDSPERWAVLPFAAREVGCSAILPPESLAVLPFCLTRGGLFYHSASQEASCADILPPESLAARSFCLPRGGLADAGILPTETWAVVPFSLPRRGLWYHSNFSKVGGAAVTMVEYTFILYIEVYCYEMLVFMLAASATTFKCLVFDATLTYINGSMTLYQHQLCRVGWGMCAPFLFMDDLNSHHRAWLGYLNANRNCISTLGFATARVELRSVGCWPNPSMWWTPS